MKVREMVKERQRKKEEERRNRQSKRARKERIPKLKDRRGEAAAESTKVVSYLLYPLRPHSAPDALRQHSLPDKPLIGHSQGDCVA